MNLLSYLKFCELIKDNPSSQESNRALGLESRHLKSKPIEQLLLWTKSHEGSLKQPLMAQSYQSYLHSVTSILVVLASFLGLFTGIGLLSYSGDAPVNVIYFIVMAGFIPLLTMLLTLFSIFRVGGKSELLIRLSPAFWMEKILTFIPNIFKHKLVDMQLNPLVMNALIIQRSQLIGLFFSLGLFVGLLMVVVSQDIAFSWSTTLHISPHGFHDFLTTLALPWQGLFPTAVPTLELIEQSHYFRLGERLTPQMINHASILGEWWKFLAMVTLFYAIFLRLGMLVFTSFELNRAIERAYLGSLDAQKLLRQMNQPMIKTDAPTSEPVFVQGEHLYPQTIGTFAPSYLMVQGWSFTQKELIVICDSLGITSDGYYEVGGANTIAHDDEVIAQSPLEVVLFVKSWEPPTMDFVDYLDDLTQKVERVIVAPVGTVAYKYQNKAEAFDIWARKLLDENHPKVWLKK